MLYNILLLDNERKILFLYFINNWNIIIIMSIGIKAIGKSADLDYNKIKNVVLPIAQRLKLHITTDDSKNNITLNLTDNGVILLECQQANEQVQISLDSQTSIMGPGFHKLVVEFIDFFTDLSGVEFDVNDDTDYYHHRDFGKMCWEHFNTWLEKVMTLLSEKEKEMISFYVNWDPSWPKPEDVPSTIVTPFGRFNLPSLVKVMKEKGIEALSEIFFPCPHEMIDWIRLDWFDLMYTLWHKCYFMPSTRSEEDDNVNMKVVLSVSSIINSGRDFPIPVDDYLKVCELADCVPCNLENVSVYKPEYPIGFRKGKLQYTVGRVNFKIPGSFLRFDEYESWGFWNGYEDDAVVRILAINTKDETPDFALRGSNVIEKGKIKGGRYVIIDAGYDGDSYITQVQLVTAGQFSLFTLAAPSELGREDALEITKDFVGGLSIVTQNLTDTINRLHDEDKHDDIVNMLKKIPEEDLTDELKGLLARAYNNLSQYDKALSLLMDIKSTHEDSALWYYRVGYAYFYLENYSEALNFFRKAVELDPDDEDSKWFIDQCLITDSFYNRVRNFWEWFEDNSKELEALLQQKEKGFERIRELMDDGLSIIGEDIYYNIGGINELTFCVEDARECFYLYPYLVSQMPESLRGKWTVHSCKQPRKEVDFVFGMYGKEINVAEIRVNARYDEENNYFNLLYYHPVLAQLPERESLNAFYIIMEHVIGEGAGYNYINEVKQASQPDNMFPIGQLTAALRFMVEESGRDYYVEPALLYTAYSREPNEDEERLRFDILCGASQYMTLNREYWEGNRDIYDGCVAKGAVPMMLILTQPEGMSNKDFIDFRHKVEDRLQQLFDESKAHGHILGGAYGTMALGYIDLMLYDGKQFIDYISEEEVYNSLLKLEDGSVCPTVLLYKDFTQNSQVLRIN